MLSAFPLTVIRFTLLCILLFHPCASSDHLQTHTLSLISPTTRIFFNPSTSSYRSNQINASSQSSAFSTSHSTYPSDQKLISVHRFLCTGDTNQPTDACIWTPIQSIFGFHATLPLSYSKTPVLNAHRKELEIYTLRLGEQKRGGSPVDLFLSGEALPGVVKATTDGFHVPFLYFRIHPHAPVQAFIISNTFSSFPASSSTSLCITT